MNHFEHFEALDSDMQAVVEQFLRFNPAPIEDLDSGNARNNPSLKNAVEQIASQSVLVRATNVAKPSLPEQVQKVEHLLIPTRGGQVNARLFYPDAQGRNLPAIVYFHGGGWVIADLNVYEPSCRALCNAAEALVISVAYRQAPEHKFPAAVNDAYDATSWVLANAAQLGADPSRVAVAGESAGGNLAAVTCLMAKEAKTQMPVAQLLIYPVTDSSMSQRSYSENEDTQPLHSNMMRWFWSNYLGDNAQAREKFAAPLLAADLSGLPPAIVITAEFDPLRDEGEQYAHQLEIAGVPVKFRRFSGVTHEFFGLAGAVSKAKEAVRFAADSLKEVFAMRSSHQL